MENKQRMLYKTGHKTESHEHNGKIELQMYSKVLFKHDFDGVIVVAMLQLYLRMCLKEGRSLKMIMIR